MRLVIVVTIVTACLVIQACGPTYVTVDQLGKLRKGHDTKAVEAIVGMDPVSTMPLTVNGIEYKVQQYPLLTGYEESKQEYGGTPWKTPGTQGYREPFRFTKKTNHTNSVLILFRNDKARYWGMMGDYSKTEDPEIAELANKIYLLQNPISTD